MFLFVSNEGELILKWFARHKEHFKIGAKLLVILICLATLVTGGVFILHLVLGGECERATPKCTIAQWEQAVIVVGIFGILAVICGAALYQLNRRSSK